MGPKHVNGNQGLVRRVGGWVLLFNLKILLAKEGSYEFSPLFSHFLLLPSVATFSSSTSALGGSCCAAATAAVLQFLLLGFLLVTHARFGML